MQLIAKYLGDDIATIFVNMWQFARPRFVAINCNPIIDL